MKVFHCDYCQQLVFFENTRCINCDHLLAYLSDVGVVASLEPAGGNEWRRASMQGKAPAYRLCENYDRDVCNWTVPAADAGSLCTSCRLTRVIPDLNQPGNKEAWYRLEVAKRRLVYNLLGLGLVLKNKVDDPVGGLAYEFLADSPVPGTGCVLTGHDGGVITINLAEADDAEREKRRVQLHEPYRTILGHLRHEIGHYYWDRLIQGSREQSGAFRRLFGDERDNYQHALKQHYEKGAPQDWQQRFISAYASSHPWEDWAETWAHYLHMADALETAAACGLSLRPRRSDEPSLTAGNTTSRKSFDAMMDDWVPLTYVLNNLNRGLGLPDGYPFVLSLPVIDKLRFVHQTIRGA